MKGDVLGAARIAGIMAAKRTHELIPLCHPLPITKVAIDIEPDHSLPGFVRAGDRQGHRPDRRRDGGADRGVGRLPDASTTWSRRSRRACGSRASGCSKSRAASPATTGADGRESRSEHGAAVGRRRARPRARRRRAAAAPRTRRSTEADGRVLAEDVAALRTQPPADLSAMDGYAVRAADVASVPATLKVDRRSRGRPSVRGRGRRGRGRAHLHRRRGAARRRHHRDPGEHHARRRARDRATRRRRPGRHIRRAGLDFRQGQVLLPRGRGSPTAT